MYFAETAVILCNNGYREAITELAPLARFMEPNSKTAKAASPIFGRSGFGRSVRSLSRRRATIARRHPRFAMQWRIYAVGDSPIALRNARLNV